ncbi:N-acetylmuramoyl-L-alanine amidase [Schnuerera sp.]|uniref:N-acetylmuramoyl-L-alanine amidase n=1 Tax=Schnuerera sp. TaxID=2794844 RepID=UPI002CF7744E|nr:N-acetylmuramoyl-L-alanine amidase [Schnuerera sp.]HSH36569.1 N-acetylmuramoyl-L-alanine amidase [Schnuerera sp.]
MVKVFLDAGHGGKDPGALGNGLREKDIALAITMKIGNILKKHGLDIRYSRTTDVFLDRTDRATMANKAGSDVFISIHCNGFHDSSVKGVETYRYTSSNSGGKLAKAIQDSIILNGVYTVNRGIKTADFDVLRLTRMPAVLVELAFITNFQDAHILKKRQDDLAIAVAKGILSNFGISYNEDGGTMIYKVQVGTFSIRANADALVKELKTKGYEAIVVIE